MRYCGISNNLYTLLINPITTDDPFWHHLALAACYAAGTIHFEDIGFVLAKKSEIRGGG